MAANAESQSKSSAKFQDKRRAFTSAMIESLINCLKQYKCPCEFILVNFNPGKVQMCEKVRQGKSNSSQFSQSQIREGQFFSHVNAG